MHVPFLLKSAGVAPLDHSPTVEGLAVQLQVMTDLRALRLGAQGSVL